MTLFNYLKALNNAIEEMENTIMHKSNAIHFLITSDLVDSSVMTVLYICYWTSCYPIKTCLYVKISWHL